MTQVKVATTQHVESWLKLEQPEIKQLATRSDELGKLASVTFADRQATPHPKNYELRSALADLLSHPKQIESALNRYNQAIEKSRSDEVSIITHQCNQGFPN